MTRVRVLIVDDHAVVRAGIRYLLEDQPDVDLIGDASGGEEALAKVSDLQPDIVLADITMPDMSGIELTRLIKERHPDTRVLLLTVHDEVEYFFRGLQAGASGYIVKGADSSELLAAFRAVQHDGVFLYPQLAKSLVQEYVRDSQKASYDGLTEREYEVLTLMAEGLPNKEIARRLGIAVTTVQTHRVHCMTKLGLNSQSDLLRYALRKGIITA